MIFGKNPNPMNDIPGSMPDLDPQKVKEASARALKSVGRFVRWFFVVVVLAVLLFNSVVITPTNRYTMIQQFGRIVSVKDSAGVSFKIPFIQQARSLPKTVLLYDLPISDVITKDKKTMVADSFVLWKVSDPLKFIQTLNGNVANAEARISTIVYNSMKNVISSLSQSDIISGRDKLAGAIFDNIGESLNQYGVELVAVETKHLDLPDDNKTAVYERMISERNNIAASYQAEGESEAKKIRTETDMTISIQISEAQANAEKIIAEGEAEYMRILSEAYADQERADFYSFVRALDAAKESLKGTDKTLILSKDSPIAQIFYQDN